MAVQVLSSSILSTHTVSRCQCPSFDNSLAIKVSFSPWTWVSHPLPSSIKSVVEVWCFPNGVTWGYRTKFRPLLQSTSAKENPCSKASWILSNFILIQSGDSFISRRHLSFFQSIYREQEDRPSDITSISSTHSIDTYPRCLLLCCTLLHLNFFGQWVVAERWGDHSPRDQVSLSQITRLDLVTVTAALSS